MATATIEKPADTKADTKAKKEPTQEEIDKAREEQLKAQGPSTLPVPSVPGEVEKLRNDGFPVVEVSTPGLPGGGPATRPGMSYGSPPPTADEIQEGLDAQEKRLEEENKEKQKEIDERKKAQKENLAKQKKQQK